MAAARPPVVNSLAHFSINADDVPRARRFYERVFGWRFTPWGPPGFLLMATGTDADPGIGGSLQGRRELVKGTAMPGYECTIAVTDVDAVAREIVASGGSIVLARTTIPTVGHLIFFRDTEGNVAGAMQYDPAAAVED